MTKGPGPELLLLRGVPPCPLHLRSPVSSFLCLQWPVRQARPRHPATPIRAHLVQRVFLLLCPFTARFIPLGYRPQEGRGPARLRRRALRPGNGRRAAWAPRALREWGKWGRRPALSSRTAVRSPARDRLLSPGGWNMRTVSSEACLVFRWLLQCSSVRRLLSGGVFLMLVSGRCDHSHSRATCQWTHTVQGTEFSHFVLQTGRRRLGRRADRCDLQPIHVNPGSEKPRHTGPSVTSQVVGRARH